MHTSSTMNETPFQQFDSLANRRPPGLLAKIISFLLAAGMLVLGFMFSLVALIVVAVVGLGLGLWIWWKTRALRKLIREQAPMNRDMPPAKGDIIEGEAVREHEAAAPAVRLLK